MDRSYLQELTEAEAQAGLIVRASQEAREKRLKEAKYDAEQQLSNERADLEREFQQASQSSAQGDQSLEVIRQEYVQKVAEVRQHFEANNVAGLDFLVDRVLSIKPEVPAVVKGKFN